MRAAAPPRKEAGDGQMDELREEVLSAVLAATGGSFKVLDVSDLLSCIPAEARADGAGVSDALRSLSAEGYIEVRYAEGGTYCLRSLPKGQAYGERVRAERVRAAEEGERRRRARRRGLFAVFVSALLGAFAGGCLAGALCALVF